MAPARALPRASDEYRTNVYADPRGRHVQPMPSAGASDKDLVLACQNGDMAAFEALYRTYFSSVYDFAARTMKDRHAAADVVQEAFIKAHAKIDQLRNPEAFRP